MKKEIKVDIVSSLKNQFIPFAGGTLLNNLPSIDGLLPVHRKVILSMMRTGRTSDKPYKKTLGAMGEIFAYYVFGDAPLYSSMVNMANNGMNNPLIDGYGQWGNKFSANGVPAHQRYTECRLSKYAEDMYKGVAQGAVPMKPNYDNTSDEAVVFPSVIPNILTNTSQSIAVGESSKIPAHNVNDVVKAITNYLDHGSNTKLIEDIGCPDLSSGGSIVYDKEVFKNIYNTGRGSFTLIGSYRYNKEKNRVEVYEVPYETTIQAINAKVIEQAEKGQLKEVSNTRIGTGNSGLRLDIDLKRGTDVEEFILKLRKFTPFESKMSVNFTVLDLDWRTPKLMSLKDIVDKWIEHRVNCIVRESEHSIELKSKRIHLLEGLNNIKEDLPKVVSTIRGSKNDSEAIQSLQNNYDLSYKQAEYVAEMKLRNINKDYINSRVEELNKLYKEVEDLKDLIQSDSRKKDLIKSQLQKVSKDFGKPRLTKVIPVEELKVYDDSKQDEIEDYNLKIFITEDLYLKKLPLTSMRGKFTNRLKEDDSFVIEDELTNTGEILVYTNKHNVYKRRIHEIEDNRPSDLGHYIPSMFDFDKGEEPLFAIPVRKEFEQDIILGFSDGTIAKINSKAYYTKQNRQVLKNGYANKELIYVGLESEGDLKAISSDGYAIVRELDKFGSKNSRNANGNKFMNVNDGETVISYQHIPVGSEDNFKMVSAGKGKRIK